MKKHLYIFSSLVFISTTLFSQVETTTKEIPNYAIKQQKGKLPERGYYSEVKLNRGDCISAEQQKEMQKQINRNVERLKREQPGLLDKTANVHPLFEWPTQAKAGFNDYGYYTVQNLVDHNLNFPGAVLDYNCGSRTYDFGSGNHRGTDIILWPFAWRRMDEQVMEVIAAAPGVIVNKVDGNFDRSCANNGAGVWNAIHVQHADGSTAWYLHFKSGSLTTKGVGDNVTTGEYLGTAGSSGSSDWPHVHFQVMDSANNLIDPYQGNCNGFNPDSWWQSQPAYNIPSVNHICTKSTEVNWYNCPDPEITFEKDTFNIGDSLWLWLYTRDMELNSTMTINLKDPNGQTLITFPFTVPWATYPTSYVRWYYLVDAWWVQGWWTFEAVYGGNTYQHPFYMTHGTTGAVENNLSSNFIVSPNPSKDKLNISFSSLNNAEVSIDIKNILGEIVYHYQFKAHAGENKISLNDLKWGRGVYFVKLQSRELNSVRKIVLE